MAAKKTATATPADKAPLTAPVEDYLKAIYELETRQGNAATSEVADALEVAPASVTGMVRRLAAQGYLDHIPYRGVQLTDAGRRAALKTIRRHRVLESYLSSVLGYPWDRVHDEAERLEHAASDELIERMAAALGHPTVDPHGAPIPTAEGRVDERRLKTIADLAVGAKARVVRVSDEDPAFLRYLGALGITPGVSVKVAAKGPFDGPVELVVGRTRHSVGLAAAGRVYIEGVGEGRGRR